MHVDTREQQTIPDHLNTAARYAGRRPECVDASPRAPSLSARPLALRSIPRALRGRDATEECRWILSLELDVGKRVLAMTGESMGVVWAPVGRALPCLGGASTSFCLLAHATMVDQVRMNEDSLALAPLAAAPKEDEDALAPLGSTSLAVEGVRGRGRGYEMVLSQCRIRSRLDCETVSRKVLGGIGADLIGNVAGGRPIKRRGRGVGAVAQHWRCCRRGVLDEHTAWSELLFLLR